MLADLVAGAGGEQADQLVEVVSLEERHAAAALAEQQMLVPVPGGDKGLATGRLVDALHKVEVLKLFERAINGHEAEGAITLAGRVVNLDRGEGAAAPGDGLDDGAARLCQTIAVRMELVQPISGVQFGASVVSVQPRVAEPGC